MKLYHYTSEKNWKKIKDEGVLRMATRFNPRIKKEDWLKYTLKFNFPIADHYTCSFFEPEPKNWKEYGLFDLLMEEFAVGDYLLELNIEDESTYPIIVREHKFHSPKEYGMSVSKWRKRKNRDSKPHLREKWYNSAVLLKNYDNTFICPEILIPFNIYLKDIKETKL